MTGGVSVRDVDVSISLHHLQHEARDQTLEHKSNSEQNVEDLRDIAQEHQRETWDSIKQLREAAA